MAAAGCILPEAVEDYIRHREQEEVGMSRRHNGEGYFTRTATAGGRLPGLRLVQPARTANATASTSAARPTRKRSRSGSSSGTRPGRDRLPPMSLSLADFLGYWLSEIAQPNLAPKTCEKYELFFRLHIIPHLGAIRLDKIEVKDIRQWLNKLGRICQCCAQGKDAARPEPRRRCCALGKCCGELLSPGTRKDARNVRKLSFPAGISPVESTWVACYDWRGCDWLLVTPRGWMPSEACPARSAMAAL